MKLIKIPTELLPHLQAMNINGGKNINLSNVNASYFKFAGQTFMVYKLHNDWYVCEFKSGLLVSGWGNKTRREAIAAAKNSIEKNVQKNGISYVYYLIKQAVKRYGYTEQARYSHLLNAA